VSGLTEAKPNAEIAEFAVIATHVSRGFHSLQEIRAEVERGRHKLYRGAGKDGSVKEPTTIPKIPGRPSLSQAMEAPHSGQK